MKLKLTFRAMSSQSRAGSEGALRHMTFVEIGGGYGNMARMVAKAYGFKTWTILDLGGRFVSLLSCLGLKKFIDNATTTCMSIAGD